MYASVVGLCGVPQEREGRKEMEPRLEDLQFEEGGVQQPARVERGGNPVSAHTQSHPYYHQCLIKYIPLTLVLCMTRIKQ